jgi:hypothetical protein
MAKALSDYLSGKTDQDMRRNPVLRLAENVLNVMSGHKG